jgi:tRNA G10  N-methylase Trm11
MARLAGYCDDEVVWDPFCGSGLELIERGLLGGVTAVHGTDLDPRAIEVARANVEAAKIEGMETEITSSFTECDFRNAAIAPGSISLIITNPPLGRRVRIKDMQGLFADLYAAASRALRVGGRLVFVNPLRTEPEDPTLQREYQRTVDLGGFNCRLEMYRKVAAGKLGKSFKNSSKSQPGKKHQEKSKADEKTPVPAPAWWSKGGHANSREARRRARN